MCKNEGDCFINTFLHFICYIYAHIADVYIHVSQKTIKTIVMDI